MNRGRKFEIREDGTVFATYTARSPESALRKAAREHQRTRADYNMEPDDDPIVVTWRAFEVGGDRRASADVTVQPGRGLSGVAVHS